jgi:formylglycine-generating enzyme required for sulfatase activity
MMFITLARVAFILTFKGGMNPLGQNFCLAALLLVLVISSDAFAQDRTALIIANFDYGEYQLTQVQADAAAVAEALRKEGFRVTVAENISGKELKSTVEKFTRSTVTRGVAFLYFAGLGGQYQTYNSKGAWWTHLQGAGKPADSRSPERESLALAEILKLFADQSSALTNCLVIDAVRPNPFLAERQNQPTGLAAVDPRELPEDTCVLFAAQPGSTFGGLDESSQLAAALAKHLPRSRESANAMWEAIRKEVEQQRGGKQMPALTTGQASSANRSEQTVQQRSLHITWPSLEHRSFVKSEPPREGSQAGEEWTNASGMVFCWCPPGKFLMGDSLAAFEDAQPVEVTLSKGFWMAKYEAAQIEGQRVGWAPNPSLTKHKLTPMHNLAHENPKKFLDLLTKAEQQAGRLPGDWEYAVPTEAQWEYACRAGSTSQYSFGDDASELARYANYADKSLLADDGALQFADSRFDDGVGKTLALVGSYSPNAWGLHDMHGNVAEWCADRYLPRLVGGSNPLVDGKVKEATGDGVIRGGAWCSTPEYCAAAFRNSEFAGKQRDFIGFRVVLRKK